MKVDIPLQEYSQSLIRNIVNDVVGVIIKSTQMPADTQIYFGGELQTTPQPGSVISDGMNINPTITKSKNYIEIDLQLDYDKESYRSRSIHANQHMKVFDDLETRTNIRPIYCAREFRFNLKFHTSSQTHAEQWRVQLTNRLTRGVNTIQHNLNYHYPIPSKILDLLEIIHTYRESVNGYNQALIDYYKEKFISRATVISNRSETNKEIAIAENQRVYGTFGFDQTVEPDDKDNETATTVFSIDYIVRAELPDSLSFTYPVIVHNQPLEDKFVIITNMYEDTPGGGYTSVSQNAYNYFSVLADQGQRPVYSPIIRIPEYDENNLKDSVVGRSGIFTGLSAITETDKRSLLNLNDLGEQVLNQDILNFISQREYSFITRPGESIFYLTYFDFEFPKNNMLVCDSQLNISSVTDLNMRSQHRVMLSIYTDLTLLKKAAIDRLKLFPNVLKLVIETINEKLRGEPIIRGHVVKSVLTKSDLIAVKIDPSLGSGQYPNPGLIVSRRTVQVASITAIKR